MYENHIDVFVHRQNTVPPPETQGALVGSNSVDGITPFFQIPRVVVPAGMTALVTSRERR
jgi:amidase